MTQERENPQSRLRPHPEDRFAPPAQIFDFAAAEQEIDQESSVARRGQRQKTLYRHGNTSLALFLFEPGAGLRQHRAAGTVFIQVLQGRLTVQAEGTRHDLTSGQVLVMSPGVGHDVHAEEPSRMLLTVCLEPSTGPSPDPA